MTSVYLNYDIQKLLKRKKKIIQTTNEAAMTDVTSLFEQKTITELRDYSLQLSLETTKVKDQFSKQLGSNYAQILDVTHSVTTLYQDVKSLDSKLMDLCFNDKQYTLGKILDEKTVDIQRDSRSNSPFNTSKARLVLAIADWSSAVTNFTKSSLSSATFDSLLLNFDTLQTTDVSGYESVVEKQCKSLEDHILLGTAPFTTLQWVKLYHLFHSKTELYQFKTDQFDALLFQSLLGDDSLLTNASSDPLIQEFVSGKTFKAKLNERLLRTIESEFNAYTIFTEEQMLVDLYHSSTIEEDISLFVRDADLYCMGLTSKKQRRLYEMVKRIVELLHDVKKYGDTKTVDDVKRRVVSLLEEEKSKNKETTTDAVLCSESTAEPGAATENSLSEAEQDHDAENGPEVETTKSGPVERENLNVKEGSVEEETGQEKSDEAIEEPSDLSQSTSEIQDSSDAFKISSAGNEPSDSFVDKPQNTTNSIVSQLVLSTNMANFRHFLDDKIKLVESI